MTKDIKRQIIIVGGGITGLSTAYHLEKLGITSILLSTSTDSPQGRISGIISGGTLDNYSRICHAHGENFAKDLWSFGDRAFDHLKRFACSENLEFSVNSRWRLLTSQEELKESELAVKAMNSAGISSKLYLRGSKESKNSKIFDGLSDRVIAVQDDGDRAGFVDPRTLFDHLEGLIACPRIAPTKKIAAKAESLVLQDESGAKFHSEMAVVACHLEIGTFIPELKGALVSVADQWIVGKEKTTSHKNPSKNITYTANHTHEWGSKISADTWLLGGGRYLRPLAGIGESKASSSSQISRHLIEKFSETFPTCNGLTISEGHGFLDCQPCDELPIIGPMFGDSRYLTATGYMGNGLTSGFYAGYCLAELIATGQCQNLPRRLWPERLRSMDSTI